MSRHLEAPRVLSQFPNKVYVGASLATKTSAAVLAESLRRIGITVTSRWHDHVGYAPTPQDTVEILESWGTQWGLNDVDDMDKANTLVLLTDVLSSSGGLWVELGYFLARLDVNILMVGKKRNVFCYHPSILHVSDPLVLVDVLDYTINRKLTI